MYRGDCKTQYLRGLCLNASAPRAYLEAMVRFQVTLPPPVVSGNFILIQKWGGAGDTARPRHRVMGHSPRYEPKAIPTPGAVTDRRSD